MSTTPATKALHVSSVNPATGELIEQHRLSSGEEIDGALDRARERQRVWGEASFEDRGEVLRAIGGELKAERERLAELMTAEMGKTLRESLAEVEKCARACDYYADHGASQLAPEPVDGQAGERYVQFPPLGVVLAIMPWNYPVWQVMRAAAPALMAGNTIVLKHASNVTGTGLALGELIGRVRESLLEVLVVRGGEVGDLIADRRIAAVTLTGSEAVGMEVAGACAKVLKKSVLELGGSDPFIVLGDADVERAAEVAVTARFQNAGQSCIAAKRFVVVDSVAEQFEDAFAERVRGLRMGDPREDVDLGPMARSDLRDELLSQVRRSLREGGRLITGGEAPAGPGAFLAPTLVADVDPENVMGREETFGPAAAIMRARDEGEAIALANASPYGLSSSLWTEDLDRARALAARIEAGAVFVNGMSASDPPMPFGGIKRSGWGRELGSFGIREFVNVQGITVAAR